MTFDQSAEALKKILERARTAIGSNSATARKAADDALHAFIENSDNRKDGIDELDDVARVARNDLALADLQDSLAGIVDRTSDVASLVKRFSTQAAVNDSSAAQLRLERVNAVLTSTNESIQRIKGLIDAVDDSTPDGQKIAASAKEAIAALNQLWKQLPKV